MKRNWGKIRRFIPMYLMLLPGLVYLFINNYMPMAGIIIAFKKYNYSLGIFKSPFTGLKNFEFLFKTKMLGQLQEIHWDITLFLSCLEQSLQLQ